MRDRRIRHRPGTIRNGIGTDNPPLALLAGRGIRVAAAEGANAPVTLALMFGALPHVLAPTAASRRMAGPES